MSAPAAIKVIVSGALRAAFLELVSVYETQSGHTIESAFGGSMGSLPTAIPNRLKNGEAADVVILAADTLDMLIEQGLVRRGSRVDLGRSRIGAAVRTGATKPDISSVEAFKRTLQQAKSIVYSSSASGVYLVGLFQRLGLFEHVQRIGKQIQGEPAGAFVARGEAELAFQQMSELMPVPGIDIVGPLPAEIQQVTLFSAGIPASATNPDLCKSFIDFLASPVAAPTIQRSGIEPI